MQNNMQIIALAPDGIGRALVSESDFKDLMKSNGIFEISSTKIVKRRKSRWEDDKLLEVQYLSSNFNFFVMLKIEKGRYKGTKWGPVDEKTFTPQPFSHLPTNLTQNELEILIRIVIFVIIPLNRKT